MSEEDICPNCEADLQGQDIFEAYYSIYNDHDKALKAAKRCGWTEENKLRASRRIGAYGLDRDIITHYECPECGHVLKEEENEVD